MNLNDIVNKHTAIRSLTVRGGVATFRFGTDDVRDLSGGALPASVSRCDRYADGRLNQAHVANVRTEDARRRAIRKAGQGSAAGAVEQWVEVRAREPQRHEWVTREIIAGKPTTFCKSCGNVRRADGGSDEKACRGPVRIGLRGAE